MTTFRSRIVPLSILTIAFSPLFARQAAAEAPDTVWRDFAVFYAEGQAPDFEGNTSLNIIAHPLPTQPSGGDRFLVDTRNKDFSGWDMVDGNGTHVSTVGAETIVFYWVYDPNNPPLNPLPPSGSRAKSGVAGDVIVYGYHVVKEVRSSCGSNCGWVIIGPAL